MKPESIRHWTPLISRVSDGDAAAIEEFYISLREMRFYFEKRVGVQLAEDAFHDMFVYVVSRIQAGVLREPERILGYVHAVARAQCFVSSRSRKRLLPAEEVAEPHDSAPNPEDQYRDTEARAIALRVLESMPAREREVLIRFYLGEQTPSEIQQSLELTATQFRLIKSRAKLRFEELCGTAIARRQTRHSGRPFDRASRSPLFKEPVVARELRNSKSQTRVA
jgi:RNA polymerase sigma factor (sigma-70 family)